MSGQKIYRSRAGWYAIEYPEGWTVEETQDLVTLYKADTGCGALQISAFRTPGEQDTRQVVLEYLSDKGLPDNGASIITSQEGPKQVSTHNYVENDWYRQIWVISQDKYLLFVTYNCKSADKDKELAEVFHMVSSVTIDPAP